MTNLSEKEIIDTLDDFITYFNLRDYEDEKNKYKKLAVDNKDIRAIKGLLDLYQKEKEKNTKIKEIIYPRPDNYIPVEVQMSEMYKKLKAEIEEE